MLRLYIVAGVCLTLALAAWQGALWLRRDAVKDFMRDAALAAAERAAADSATKARIEDEIDNSTVDQLRDRAARGGMFLPTD